MNILLRLINTIILFTISIVFIVFAMQNTAEVPLVIMPELSYTVKLYTIVLGFFAAGFISALFITRFDQIKNNVTIPKFINKFKISKKKSKYIED